MTSTPRLELMDTRSRRRGGDGLVLIHSAVSPNIRERRDCFAALFDAAVK